VASCLALAPGTNGHLRGTAVGALRAELFL